jgi:hypothetical protein
MINRNFVNIYTYRALAFLALFFLASNVEICKAANGEIKKEKEFSVLILEKLKANKLGQNEIQQIADEVVAKLVKREYVSDEAVNALLVHSRNFESPGIGKNTPKSVDGKLFPVTSMLVKRLLPLVEDRKSLLATIYRQQGNIYLYNSDNLNASVEFSKAEEVLSVLSVEIGVLRVQNLVDLGNSLRRRGVILEADAAYVEALRYPYWIIRNPQSYPKLQSLYLEAGRGLIEVRKNRLEALKSTRFVEGAQDELNPLLEVATKEAQEMKDHLDQRIKNQNLKGDLDKKP